MSYKRIGVLKRIAGLCWKMQYLVGITANAVKCSDFINAVKCSAFYT